VTAEEVLDGLTTAVVVVDEALCVATLNSACESLFGISRRMTAGAPLVEAIPHFKSYEARLHSALHTATGFIERETALSRNGDPAVTVDWTVTPFTIGGKQRLFAEPPHMQASMLFLPHGAPVPSVGDEVDVRVRYTTATFDRTTIS